MAVLTRTSGPSTECVANVASELTRWPDLSLKLTRKGLVFRAGRREIVRMRGDHTAELQLTAPIVTRWSQVLADSHRVTMGRDDGWVVVEVEDQADAELFLSLVSVAIQANQR